MLDCVSGLESDHPGIEPGYSLRRKDSLTIGLMIEVST